MVWVDCFFLSFQKHWAGKWNEHLYAILASNFRARVADTSLLTIYYFCKQKKRFYLRFLMKKKLKPVSSFRMPVRWYFQSVNFLSIPIKFILNHNTKWCRKCWDFFSTEPIDCIVLNGYSSNFLRYREFECLLWLIALVISCDCFLFRYAQIYKLRV